MCISKTVYHEVGKNPKNPSTKEAQNFQNPYKSTKIHLPQDFLYSIHNRGSPKHLEVVNVECFCKYNTGGPLLTLFFETLVKQPCKQMYAEE